MSEPAFIRARDTALAAQAALDRRRFNSKYKQWAADQFCASARWTLDWEDGQLTRLTCWARVPEDVAEMLAEGSGGRVTDVGWEIDGDDLIAFLLSIKSHLPTRKAEVMAILNAYDRSQRSPESAREAQALDDALDELVDRLQTPDTKFVAPSLWRVKHP